MAFRLTEEQEAVVRDSEKRLTVRASAGAGKTSVLVRRYLRLVEEDGFRADEILTITFTRKAAAEMKSRIVRSLLDAGLPDQAQIAETGPIQTIHGFCERLLRENALEAGLDPDFTVLGDAESARLLENAVLEAISVAPEAGDEAAELVALLTGKIDFRGGPAPHGKLSAALKQVLGPLRACGRTVDDIQDAHASPADLLRRWEEMLLSDVPGPVREALARQAPADSPALAIRTAFRESKCTLPPWTPKSDAEARSWAEAETLCATRSVGLMQLACTAWRSLEREMRKAQALDFTMLESEAVRLLHTSETARAQVRRQYKAVLVDEAQDLNPVQYTLIGALGIDKEMLVGDAQQSIYGFRQAEVRLFQQRIKESNSRLLSQNHRSAPGILAFVDTLFGRIWPEDYAPMGRQGTKAPLDSTEPADMQGVELWMLQSKDTAQVAEWIAELRDEGESLRDIAVLIPTLQSALDVLGRLEAQGLPARIVGGTERFYARLEIRDIANALRALSDPYDDFSLTALLRSPMAGLSLDSIVTLAARRPVIEALQSFEPPVAEDADVIKRFLEWFTPMSRDVDRPAAWEVISEVIERTQYLDALGRRRNGPQLIANVRKLLRLASRQPETGPMEFAEQIREIQQIGHREGDAPATDEDLDAVTILTVHKAKGLEFPVVIVPDLYRRLGGRMSDLVVEPWLATISTNYEGKMCLYHKWLSERTRSRERQEQDRVLYVALTRAKRRLCVCVCPSPQPYHMAGVISKHLGLPDRHYPGMVIRRAEMIARGVEPGSRSPAAER